MKKSSIKDIQENRGITLIALVITIIVLLILAGVSIAMLTGENGLLTKVGDAKVKNEEGEIKEEIALAWNSVQTDGIVNNLNLVHTKYTSFSRLIKFIDKAFAKDKISIELK